MNQKSKRKMTRREFLMITAFAGGSASVYAAMRGLGMLGESENQTMELEGSGNGASVIILGAGLAGMAAAYELKKLGYQCKILEARNRPGGRCWTVRGGAESEEEGDGQNQVASFDDGLYFNPGPARIPHHHTVILNYCRELNVPVEIFANQNSAAYFYNEGEGNLKNQRIRVREVKADTFGYASELLAKAINQDALDSELTADDQRNIFQYLYREGALSHNAEYLGSDRRGFVEPPGAFLEPGSQSTPFELSDLLDSELANYLFFEELVDFQMTMLQIVGGTDRLALAFADQVGHLISYEAKVSQINQTEASVEVIFTDQDNQSHTETADYCICTIPLPVLRSIPADFSAEMKTAIASVGYTPAGKMGLQFSRRFWEEDDQIYGGISRTNMPITQIWYPSSDFHANKGILVGYYDIGQPALASGRMTTEERLQLALTQGRKIHPQYDANFETAFSVAWHHVPYNLGGWANYTDETRVQAYPILSRPDGRVYLAGEHMSYLTGWMAGALESAQQVVKKLHEHIQASE